MQCCTALLSPPDGARKGGDAAQTATVLTPLREDDGADHSLPLLLLPSSLSAPAPSDCSSAMPPPADADPAATLVDVALRAPATTGHTATAPLSPELHANALSRLSWWWLNGLMRRGISTPLDEEDCYALRPELTAAQVGQRFDDEWRAELRRFEKDKDQATDSPNSAEEKTTGDAANAEGDKPAAAAVPAKAAGPSLAAVFYRLHKREFILGGVAKGIADGLGLLQPILLQYLIEFLVDWSYAPLLGQSRPPEWHGIVLSVALGVCPLLAGLLENAHQQNMTLMGFRIRTALVRAMYSKSLLLSSRARAIHSSGKIVNVMSSDTFLLDQFLQYMHLCWSASCMIIVAIALLIRAIGWPAVVGLSVLVVLLPFAGFVMNKWFTLYAAQAPIKDARVKRINEILQCIRSTNRKTNNTIQSTRTACSSLRCQCARAAPGLMRMLTLALHVLLRIVCTHACAQSHQAVRVGR